MINKSKLVLFSAILIGSAAYADTQMAYFPPVPESWNVKPRFVFSTPRLLRTRMQLPLLKSMQRIMNVVLQENRGRLSLLFHAQI